jgi:flavin reductase (DIM6/NTAB) family NADH-FMN oxidoreductase RutF/rubredoxin
MIDFNALFKISYGMYVVSSGNRQVGNAYISNTVFQVTANPPQVATCCSKDNFTLGIIQQTMAFAVTVLHQQTSSELFGRLGYKSGKDFNKFEGIRLKYGESGLPIVMEDAIAALEFNVVQSIDLGSHIMFIGQLIHSELFDVEGEPMTYAFYREVKKGAAPKNAPTFQEKVITVKETVVSESKRYQCLACDYIYDDAENEIKFVDLPDDWECPLCGSPKSIFVEIQ